MLKRIKIKQHLVKQSHNLLRKKSLELSYQPESEILDIR